MLTMISRGIDLKVVVIGNSFIGKTSMLKKYVGKYDIGREPFVTKKLQRDGETITLLIHDTMGQERYRSLTSSYYRGARGCMLCFDVMNSSSFDGLRQWNEDIKECIRGGDIPKVLIGLNRSNVSRDNSARGKRSKIDSYQKVPSSKIDLFCEELQITYLEVELNDADKIAKAFDTLVDLIIADKQRRQSEIDADIGVIHLPRTSNQDNVTEKRCC